MMVNTSENAHEDNLKSSLCKGDSLIYLSMYLLLVSLQSKDNWGRRSVECMDILLLPRRLPCDENFLNFTDSSLLCGKTDCSVISGASDLDLIFLPHNEIQLLSDSLNSALLGGVTMMAGGNISIERKGLKCSENSSVASGPLRATFRKWVSLLSP